MHADTELEFSIADLRESERFDVRMPGDIRRSGSRAIPAFVTDLSVSGFRVQAEERLPRDSIVWLRLGSLAPQMARVKWSRQFTAGCRFDTPLHPYILEQFRTSMTD